MTPLVGTKVKGQVLANTYELMSFLIACIFHINILVIMVTLNNIYKNICQNFPYMGNAKGIEYLKS